MNVSVIEDWARVNNRQPEHYENGSTVSTGENTTEAAKRHLSPIIQLLQWLQCFSSLGEDHEALVGTLTQLQRLTPTQLIHIVKSYRSEVGETSLPKGHMNFLVQLQKGRESLVSRAVTSAPNGPSTPQKPATPQNGTAKPAVAESPASTRPPPSPSIAQQIEPDTDPPSSRFTLDPSLMLPFSLPTSTDMLITYGAGIGGTNRERARKYIPTVPTEVLSKLNLDGDSSDAASIRTMGTTAQGWRNGA